MGDSAPPLAASPGGDSAPPAPASAEKPSRRHRAPRGGKNRAIMGSGDAVAAEKGEANAETAETSTKAPAKPRAKRQPREQAHVTHEKLKDGELAKERGEKPPRASRKPRERKPCDREKGGHADEREPNETDPTPPAAPEAKREKPEREPSAEAPRDDAAEPEPEVDWSTASWFSGCDADLGTAYWLLSRCFASSDVAALASEALVRRAVRLQQLAGRFKTELLPQDEDDDKPPRAEWAASEILREAMAAFPESERRGGSPVLAQLEGEVVEAATELLTGRVGRGNLALLTQWERFLASLLPEPVAKKPNKKTQAKAEGEGEGPKEEETEEDERKAETEAAAEEPATPLAPERRRRAGGSVNNAIAHAKVTVSAAVAFHRAYERRCVETEADGTSADLSAATAQWTSEIAAVVEATLVSPAEEARRKGVAAQIESAFRRASQWRRCDVLLFGSSLSKFGAKSSDLDLCLRAHAPQSEAETAAKMSVRELRLRMRRLQQEQHGDSSRNDDALFLDETLTKTRRTVEALATTAAKQRKKTKSKDAAKLQKLVLLGAHWRSLAVAFAFFRDKAGDKATAKHEASAAAAAYHAALHRQQKERQKDIYAAAALLGRSGCHVELVVAHARVPVIGFTHKSSGLDCDLCFENYHACVNTLLLRAYAELDPRARALGLAVKHWAKRRGLNDASQGYLSSYSFILLVLFFLQHKARVLPNLQHPELLREADVAPVALNGVDVSFCSDLERARAFHAKTERSPAREATVGELLRGFFRFYADEFDFSECVVSVRHPETPMRKHERWTRGKLKAWRVSLEDPLELDRDLGSVLQLRCQQRILEELQRARSLLELGKSFETDVCVAAAAVGKPPRKKAEKQEKKGKDTDATKKQAGKKDAERKPKDANADGKKQQQKDGKDDKETDRAGRQDKPTPKERPPREKKHEAKRPPRKEREKEARWRPRGDAKTAESA